MLCIFGTKGRRQKNGLFRDIEPNSETTYPPHLIGTYNLRTMWSPSAYLPTLKYYRDIIQFYLVLSKTISRQKTIGMRTWMLNALRMLEIMNKNSQE